MAERVEFVSRALHSPAVSTLERATKNGYFTSFPLVTTKQLRRFPPDQRATLMRHMCAQRSNLRSTKTTPKSIATSQQYENNPTLPQNSQAMLRTQQIPSIQPEYPSPPRPQTSATHERDSTDGLCTEDREEANTRTNFMFADCEEVTGQIHTDQTSQFLIPSAAGNNYLLILFDCDSSYIMPIPLRTRMKKALLETYATATSSLVKAGLRPKCMISTLSSFKKIRHVNTAIAIVMHIDASIGSRSFL